MKKVYLFLILGIFLVSLTSAAVDTQRVDDVFKVNEIVNYAKPCFYNGTYCSDSAICNYTIFAPDKTIIRNNVQADNNVSNHNLTVSFQEIGIYQIDMVCIDQGRFGAETFFAQITGSGFNETSAFYIVILLLSFGVIIFGLWLGDAPITIFGTFGLYFLALYILFNGIVGIKDMVTTWALGLITLGIALYISIKSAHELIVG